jgi:hypothetical protein
MRTTLGLIFRAKNLVYIEKKKRARMEEESTNTSLLSSQQA